MPRFTVGDRVQLAGDIAGYYKCVIGVIEATGGNAASVLNQYWVRLADGTVGEFFDFQLQNPLAVAAAPVFDSAVSKTRSGTRGALSGRHLQFVARDVDIHLKVSSATKSVIGQVTSGLDPTRWALITIEQDGHIQTKSPDEQGLFDFSELAEGDVRIELLTRDRRVIATFKL
jgi:hypothetical protein